MATKTKSKKQQQSDPYANDPLVGQIRQLLNTAGTLDQTNLDKAGNLPILREILKEGYQNEGAAPGQMIGMTDKQALGEAIHRLRGGEPLTGMTQKDFENQFTHIGPKTHTTASEEILKSLIAEHSGTALGKTPAQAHDTVAGIVKDELGRVKGTAALQNAGGTLTPEEVASIQAKYMPKDSGAGGGSGVDLASAITKAGRSEIDQQYVVGQENVNQYLNAAQLMGGSIPQGLQPIYQGMVAQRAQEMQHDLDMTRKMANFEPYADELQFAASEYLKGPKASSANLLNQALSGLGSASGAGLGNRTPLASKGGLTGFDLGNQLNEAIKWYSGIGGDFASLNKFVTSPSQISELQKFVPSSKAGYKALPTFLKLLGQ